MKTMKCDESGVEKTQSEREKEGKNLMRRTTRTQVAKYLKAQKRPGRQTITRQQEI